MPVYKRGLQRALRRGQTLLTAGNLPIIVDSSSRRHWNAYMVAAILLGLAAQINVIFFSFTFREKIVSDMGLRQVACQSGPVSAKDDTYLPLGQSRCAITDGDRFRFKNVVENGTNISCTETLREDAFAISITPQNVMRGPLKNCTVNNGTGIRPEYDCQNASFKCFKLLGMPNNLCLGFLFIRGRVYMAATGAIQTERADVDEAFLLEGVSILEARLANKRIFITSNDAGGALLQEKTKKICSRQVQVGRSLHTEFNESSIIALLLMAAITTVSFSTWIGTRKVKLQLNTLTSKSDFIAMIVRDMDLIQDGKIQLYTIIDAYGRQEVSVGWKKGHFETAT